MLGVMEMNFGHWMALESAMQQGNEPGYNRPDCFVIDDWR